MSERGWVVMSHRYQSHELLSYASDASKPSWILSLVCSFHHTNLISFTISFTFFYCILRIRYILPPLASRWYPASQHDSVIAVHTEKFHSLINTSPELRCESRLPSHPLNRFNVSFYTFFSWLPTSQSPYLIHEQSVVLSLTIYLLWF